MGGRTTLEHSGPDARDDAPRALGPLLFRIACADDLPQPSARYSLARFERVELGRGDLAGADARGTALRIDVPDPFASSRHAHLERRGDDWLVRDEGSTNGTWIDGVRAAAGESLLLRDGGLLEIGHTFFLFRRSARGVVEFDLEPASGAPEPPTLQPEWELELSRAARLAGTAHGLLIEGESGTGKEVLARFLHEKSGRAGPLVSVNCGGLPETMFEDELFGHVRGAFSGAQAEREGLFRAAHRGTLLLDEVGEMPHGLQIKLLRVLEDQMVRPLGSEKEIQVDVRVIAATHRDLEALVAQGRFREDLLARLGLLSLRIPPLRERKEDLGLLIRAVLRTGAIPLEKIRIDLDALRVVLLHPWPLNVRELRRALLAAVDLARAGEGQTVTLYPHHLPASVRERQASAQPAGDPGKEGPARPARPVKLDLSPTERELRDRIVEHLRRAGGNVTEVARQMGKGRTQIQRWIARYGIDVESARQAKD